VALAADVPLIYWEEVRVDNLRIDPVEPNKTLRDLELGNGDIVVFQVKFSVCFAFFFFFDPCSEKRFLCLDDFARYGHLARGAAG
jgi:hypothetical protein